MLLFNGDTFTRGERTFRFHAEWDQCMGAPWKEHDGHGPVSEWTTRDKRPGERVLHEDRGSRRYYDFEEAVRIAKHDGWGLGDEALIALTRRLGRRPTRKEIVAQTVENDFDRLRRWCNDDWSWIAICVTEVESGKQVWLGGVESDDEAYRVMLAHELADELNAELDDKLAEDIQALAMFSGVTDLGRHAHV